ncbi:hypothetical protein [Planomonospora parontospora]|nr:hypothetical protein [Planomonospora parontospora]
MEKGRGEAEAARRTLTDLLEDLTRLYGPCHPAAVRVRESLGRLEL